MSRRYMKLKEDMPLSAAKIEDNTLASGCSVSRLMSFISLYLHLPPFISFYINLLLSKRQSELAKVELVISPLYFMSDSPERYSHGLNSMRKVVPTPTSECLTYILPL